MESRETPRPGASWTPLLVMLGVVGLLIGAALFFVLNHVRASTNRTKSQDNIRTLSHLHRDLALNGVAPPVGGKAYVLWPVARGLIQPDVPGNLEVLFSPADGNAPEDPPIAEYRALTEERLLAGADVQHLTSYVGPRRGPETEAPQSGAGPRPLIADLHFEDGAIVGFADGRVHWLTRKDLGLGPDDPIIAGPTSKSPLLRRLSE